MQYANENLAIIADDLTGACDTACQFALYGFQPIVVSCLEPNLSTFWRKGFQDGVSAPAHAGERAERCAYHQDSESALLVVNTDSRKADGRSAARTVAEIARTLRRGRWLLFYKKMDSTLKGNWAPELAAVVTVAQPDLTVIAPAFPVRAGPQSRDSSAVRANLFLNRAHQAPHQARERRNGSPTSWIG